MRSIVLDRVRVITSVAAITAGIAVGSACQSSGEPADDEPAPTEPTQSQSDDQMELQQSPEGQNQPPESDPGTPPEGQQEIDDETFGQFVDALVATLEYEEEARQEMQQAETQEEARQAQQEVMARIQQEVEGAGLTMQEYAQIGQRMQRDPEFEQRVRDELDDRGKGDLLNRAPQQPQQEQPQQRRQPGQSEEPSQPPPEPEF